MPQASTFMGTKLINELDELMRDLSAIPHSKLRMSTQGRTLGWAHSLKSDVAVITRETSYSMIGTVDGLDIIVYSIDGNPKDFDYDAMPSCCSLNLGLFNPELEICWPMTTAQLVAYLDLKTTSSHDAEVMIDTLLGNLKAIDPR